MSLKDLHIFSGSANPELAREICDYLGLPPGKILLRRFLDGEMFVEIGENVRGADVYVIQPTCHPVNDNLMELLIIIDALKRASAASITAVIPYYGYARQDRKVAPRTPITSKLVADLLTASGVHRVVAMDLHAGQIQGFFNIPFDNLYAINELVQRIRLMVTPNTVVVSPDSGGMERIRAYSERLGCPIAIIDKRREQANVSEVMNIIGKVKGKECIIVDDLIDTAGTLVNSVEALKREGATRVVACATHAVLSGPAAQRISGSSLERIILTNTIPLQPALKEIKKIDIVPVGNIFGEAIRRIHTGDSISSLFFSTGQAK